MAPQAWMRDLGHWVLGFFGGLRACQHYAVIEFPPEVVMTFAAQVSIGRVLVFAVPSLGDGVFRVYAEAVDGRVFQSVTVRTLEGVKRYLTLVLGVRSHVLTYPRCTHGVDALPQVAALDSAEASDAWHEFAEACG